jgi:serine/threonine protein kinase
LRTPLSKFLNLFDSLNQEIDVEFVTSIIRDVVNGLVDLKLNNISVHRDIKPENLLVSEDFVIEITDFGVSKELVNGKFKGNTGTKSYIAPTF